MVLRVATPDATPVMTPGGVHIDWIECQEQGLSRKTSPILPSAAYSNPSGATHGGVWHRGHQADRSSGGHWPRFTESSLLTWKPRRRAVGDAASGSDMRCDM